MTVLYFATASTDRIRQAITGGVLGCMATPANGLTVEPGWAWAADNDRYNRRHNWQASTWLRFLERHTPVAGTCRFAAVPDQVADPDETDRLWNIWQPVVTELGYPPAYVAQDGCTEPPWDELAVLFIGGSTDWKKSPDAWALAATAQTRGVPVHWGRVNSRRRFAMAALNGDTADGTFLAFGPDKNLPRLVGWLNTLDYP